jgi:2-methylisocitrate lyase-like PEP mutase family enzyme
LSICLAAGTPILSVKEQEQLGHKIVVCPIESLMVCARANARLVRRVKNTGRVDKLAPQAMSFAEVKESMGLDEVLKAPGKALKTNLESGNGI